MGNWYSARLLYECVVDDDMPDAEHTWEETTIIFQCGDDENMESKLANLAKKAEVRYDNVYGNPVKWTFRELLEVQEISGHELADGTEVFFRFWTSPDAKDFEFLRRTHTEPWWPQVNLEECRHDRKSILLQRAPRPSFWAAATPARGHHHCREGIWGGANRRSRG